MTSTWEANSGIAGRRAERIDRGAGRTHQASGFQTVHSSEVTHDELYKANLRSVTAGKCQA